MDVIKDFQHPIHVEQHKDCSLMVYMLQISTIFYKIILTFVVLSFSLARSYYLLQQK